MRSAPGSNRSWPKSYVDRPVCRKESMTIRRSQKSDLVSVLATSVTCTWSVNPTPGDTVIMMLQTNLPSSVVDNGSPQRSFFQDRRDSVSGMAIYRAINVQPPVGSNYTVTATMANGGQTMCGQAYSGRLVNGPLVGGGFAGGINTGTSALAAGIVTPTIPGRDSLHVAVMTNDYTSNNSATVIPQQSWLLVASQIMGNTWGVAALADYISPDGINTSCLWTVDSSNWRTLHVAYSAVHPVSPTSDGLSVVS